MRILMLDNTNNVNFELAVSLSKLGHESTLVLFQAGLLHHPNSIDTFYKIRKNIKVRNFQKYYAQEIIDSSQVFLNDFKTIVQSKFDVALVNGIGLGLTEYLSCPWIIVTTGSDIHYWADNNLSQIMSKSWSREFKSSQKGIEEINSINTFTTKSQNSIVNALGFITHPPNFFPETDYLLSTLNSKRKTVIPRIWVHPIIFYYKKIQYNSPFKNNCLIINFARLDNLDENERLSIDNKGTRNLLLALKRLSDEGFNFKCIFFEKGKNIESVKDTIIQYKISDKIIWKKPVSYKSLCYLMQSSNVIGILDSVGASCIGKVAIMGYYSRKPTIGNMSNAYWKYIFESENRNPILYAHNVDSAYEQIKLLLLDKDKKSQSIINLGFRQLKIHRKLNQEKTSKILSWIKSLLNDI
jgi:hypothetical protein